MVELLTILESLEIVPFPGFWDCSLSLYRGQAMLQLKTNNRQVSKQTIKQGVQAKWNLWIQGEKEIWQGSKQEKSRSLIFYGKNPRLIEGEGKFYGIFFKEVVKNSQDNTGEGRMQSCKTVSIRGHPQGTKMFQRDAKEHSSQAFLYMMGYPGEHRFDTLVWLWLSQLARETK